MTPDQIAYAAGVPAGAATGLALFAWATHVEARDAIRHGWYPDRFGGDDFLGGAILFVFGGLFSWATVAVTLTLTALWYLLRAVADRAQPDEADR